MSGAVAYGLGLGGSPPSRLHLAFQGEEALLPELPPPSPARGPPSWAAGPAEASAAVGAELPSLGQLGPVLAELAAALRVEQTAREALAERVQGLADQRVMLAELGSMGQQMKSLQQGRLRALEERVEVLARARSAAAPADPAEAGALARRVEALEQQVAGLPLAVPGGRQGADAAPLGEAEGRAAVEQHHRQLAHVGDCVRLLRDRDGKLAEQLQSLQGQVDVLAASVAEIGAGGPQALSLHSNQSQHAEALGSAIGHLRERHRLHDEEIASLSSQVRELAAAVAEANPRQALGGGDSPDGPGTAVDADCAALGTGIRQLAERHRLQHEEFARLSGQVQDLSDRLDLAWARTASLAESSAELHQEAAAGAAASAAGRASAAPSREDGGGLGAALAAVQRVEAAVGRLEHEGGEVRATLEQHEKTLQLLARCSLGTGGPEASAWAQGADRAGGRAEDGPGGLAAKEAGHPGDRLTGSAGLQRERDDLGDHPVDHPRRRPPAEHIPRCHGLLDVGVHRRFSQRGIPLTDSSRLLGQPVRRERSGSPGAARDWSAQRMMGRADDGRSAWEDWAGASSALAGASGRVSDW